MEGESLAAQQFQSGQYSEALVTYTACLSRLPASSTQLTVSLLLNRSACHLKLKSFAKVVEDCDSVLKLEPRNSKAQGRKIKALCSLGSFARAHSLAEQWLEDDPENAQAQQEVKRLGGIMKAINEQEKEEEPLEILYPDKSQLKPPVTSTHSPHTSSVTMVTRASDSEPPISRHTHTSHSVRSSDNPPVDSPVSASHPTNSHHNGPTLSEPRPSYSSKVKGSQNKGDPTPDSDKLPTVPMTSADKPSGNEGKEWKCRPPPRGLTAQEYTLCPRGSVCPLGDLCPQAHSEQEMVEWKERFTLKHHQFLAAKASDKVSYADQLLEKYMTAKDKQLVMTDSMDGVTIHCSTSLSARVSSKHASNYWLFTVTSKMSLKRVVLLNEDSERRFTIVMVTIGPKRDQEKQSLREPCYEWVNTKSGSGRGTADRVHRIKVRFETEIYGTFRQWLVCDFGTEPVIGQQLCAESSLLADLQQLQKELIVGEQERWDLATITTVPFSPRVMVEDADDEALLAQYPAPMATRFTASDTLLEPALTADNYQSRMHSLLYIEEMAQFLSIAKYNMRTSLQLVDRFMLMPSWGSTAKYAHNNELFARMSLCEALSEDTAHGRLILQNISSVYLAPHSTSTPDKVYEALVEDKGKTFLFLKLSAETVEDLGLKMDTKLDAQVQFQLNRMTLSEMHLAVDLLPDVSKIFPSIVDEPSIPWSPKLLWSSQADSKLNPKQKEAVVAMTAEKTANLHPVLLVGPYGTGKTFTLAQATLEILKAADTRVLICTHSNSAADLYIQEYLHPYVEDGHPEATPLRLFYRYRWVQTVSPVVRQYALLNTDTSQAAQFRKPTLEEVEARRVVVTTLGTSRYLHQLHLPPDFFTHILVDEAAQALECEVLLPLSLAGPDTRVVLAGDHVQLSPEVHSQFARECGFNTSLLERLYDAYPPDNHHRIPLCENYRSHKAIIDFTSELFYNKNLVASGNQKSHPTFYPLTFFTAQGEDEQHQNSTSYHNNAEVYEVAERVEEIQKQWPKAWGPLEDSSIGVVSPYSDQVMRIRAELRKRKMFRVSVERVLNVQGKQFRVIFLSTVRTRATCVREGSEEDGRDYGFLSNTKLLNTAVTRARSLVAVVGDPVSLCSIGKCRKIWEKFIEVCEENKSLYGMRYSNLRRDLDGVEIKKTYTLNPLAPEFIPNRLRHGNTVPPEPVVVGKYGYTFSPGGVQSVGARAAVMPQAWNPKLANPYLSPQLLYQMMGVPRMLPPYGYIPYAGRPLTSSPLTGSPLTSSPLTGSPRTQRRTRDKSEVVSSFEGVPLVPMRPPYARPAPFLTPLSSSPVRHMALPGHTPPMNGTPPPALFPPRLSTPAYKFLPTACNVRSSSPANARLSPSNQATPSPTNTRPASNNDEVTNSNSISHNSKSDAALSNKASSQNAQLQWELFNYMQRTEGTQSTNPLVQKLSQVTQTEDKDSQAGDSEVRDSEASLSDLEAATRQSAKSAWASYVPDSSSVAPLVARGAGTELKEAKGTYLCSELEKQSGVDSIINVLDNRAPTPPSHAQRPKPLYLRGTVKQNDPPQRATAQNHVRFSSLVQDYSQCDDPLSYAGALVSEDADVAERPARPPVSPLTPSQIPPATPITPRIESLEENPFFRSSRLAPLEDEEEPVDPLEVLRNLHIKPSPATEALYQYFS